MEETKFDSLVYIDYKNDLLKNRLEKDLADKIVAKVRNLENFVAYKLDPELILLVCDLIENGFNDYNLKTNKKEFALRLLSVIYNYTAAERNQADCIIEFLHKNKHIKKVKLYKKLYLITKDWFRRKFL